MGIVIKRNSKNRFVIKSPISDMSYHPEEKNVSLDEAKRILIHEALFAFIDKVIEIDMDFPNGYFVNGKMCREKPTEFLDWKLYALKTQNPEVFEAKFQEIYVKLGLEFWDLNKEKTS